MVTGTAKTGTKHPRKNTLTHRLWARTYHFVQREYRRTTMSSLKGVPALLTVIAVGLTAFGLIMVLSASSVEQIAAGSSPFTQVERQLIFAVLGIVLMTLLAFVPVSWYRNRWVMYGTMGLAIVMQLLVMAVGTTVNGNRNWIQLGGISIQPSEISKLVTALWMAWVLTQQGYITRGYRKALFPLLFGIVPLLGLILLGHDVGTVVVYALMVLGVLWLAGMNPRGFVIGIVMAALGGLLTVISSPNRLARVFGVFGNCQGSTCDQSNSGLAALATGGFWGVGLGSSRQKYNYLPEAHNDYIFAVIGEELGLLGTLLIIFLYLGLTYCVIRIMLRSADRFVSLASGTILVWISGQAIINIAMVTGMLPVIGIPLPFISYGGTSLISSLAAIGILIGFARQTPLQPIVENGEYAYYAAGTPKEHTRRAKLGRIVERENARIEAEGTNAGFDIKSWFTYFGIGAKKAPISTRAGSYKESSQQRQSQNPPRTTEQHRKEHTYRQNTRPTARETTSVSGANRTAASLQHRRRQQLSTALQTQPRKQAVPKKKTSTSSSPKKDLPPGLAPMRQIRARRRKRDSSTN